jgi:hypothetical protein
LIRRLSATLLLLLALSPYNAPFRTCDPPSESTNAIEPIPNGGESDSVAAPLVTRGGRLTLVLPLTSIVWHFVPAVVFTPLIPPRSHTPHDTIRPTVLRV